MLSTIFCNTDNSVEMPPAIIHVLVNGVDNGFMNTTQEDNILMKKSENTNEPVGDSWCRAGNPSPYPCCGLECKRQLALVPHDHRTITRSGKSRNGVAHMWDSGQWVGSSALILQASLREEIFWCRECDLAKSHTPAAGCSTCDKSVISGGEHLSWQL
jgi:hypothetical protein